ncbi:MAG TPA: PilZ domain-containing protein [Planctomycetes bacterium]|nr:PilZ domain-containing protein [Planctomycetota bacterium]
MSGNRWGREKRSAFRFPVPAVRQKATLHVGSRGYEGRLVNESAGGFAFCSVERPEVEPGATVTVESVAGRSSARVVYVRRDRAPLLEAIRDAPGASRWWLVGLERIADLPDENQIPRAGLWSRLPWATWQIVSPGTVLSGVILAALCVAVPWALMALATKLDHRDLRSSKLLDGPLPGLGRGSGSRSSQAATAPRRPAQRAIGERPSTLSVVGRQLDRLHVFSTPGVFLSTEMADRLSLSPQQQREIRRLVEASRLFRQVGDHWELVFPRRDTALVRERLAQLEEQALAVLTDQQRALFDSLRAARESAETGPR